MTLESWNPDLYAAYRDLRLRPALDLLSHVPLLPAGEIVDLGCGAGAVAGALLTRFPGQDLVGVDASAAMLSKALGYGRTELADIARWQPAAPPVLIFSNAALHWLSDHAVLIPRLAGFLAPRGVLAVQMPDNFDAPSHALLRGLAPRLFPERFAAEEFLRPVAPMRAYRDMLAPLGAVRVWQTEYLQELGPVDSGHPVRHFTRSTAMLPYLARLSEAEGEALIRAYDAALAEAYPLLPDGGALFPFRRLFFVHERPG
ncbi:methyltransferase domain-containing protein [Pseudogemmobacter sonorensis]|uniref:methyltransferase domain-containing protein n=1 Tax=Pseudogemmobacter sonorensis TaxID=2989681 RepID=UPI003694B82F